MAQPKSIEQFVRDLLERAIHERIVALAVDEWDDPDPQCRSSGELVGLANMVSEYLRGRRDG